MTRNDCPDCAYGQQADESDMLYRCSTCGGTGDPLSADQIQDRISPILFRYYGENGMTRALAVHLASEISTFDDDKYYRGREDMIMQQCWNWMTGGGTAELCAREIEAAL